jgi:hypothetical protein
MIKFVSDLGHATNTTDHHGITEILLKVALNAIKQTTNNSTDLIHRQSNSGTPFSSFGPSRDYGMDLCLEVYL